MAGSICVHAVPRAKSWQSLQSLYGKPDSTLTLAESEGSCETLALEEVLAPGRSSTENSAHLYTVDGWGSPYFSVSLDGHLMVRPHGDEGASIDLYEVATSLKDGGLEFPMLFRFPEIVGHRVAQLQGCFDAAIAHYAYSGAYRGAFPVKCNHDRDLVAAVMAAGARSGWGLEVGSRPELLLAMSALAGRRGALLVCNGYKDAAYVELVVHCWQLGLEAVVVLEQFQELEVVLAVAAARGVRPVLGVRAKLSTRHGGHWGTTSGEHAKFGLRPREIVGVVHRLAAAGLLECLQLLHFHIGSQITNIGIVKEAMAEGAYLFAELAALGARMRIIDCGGGLGIDYDGSATDAPPSIAYTMQNYANDVVCALRDVCAERGIAPPTIVTESGRAIASHHAVLVFDVISRPPAAAHAACPATADGEDPAAVLCAVPGMQGQQHRSLLPSLQPCAAAASKKGGFLLGGFREVYAGVEATSASLCEAYSDAVYYKEEALRAFKLGVLSLPERAAVDALFDATCDRILAMAAANGLPLPEALQPGTRPHAATYHINLSIFRSALDSWSIGQLFPILPIHRLDEEPTVAATLADLTCDSDGKVDRFISAGSGEGAPVLPLHELNGQPYLLAMFFTGAYQEVLGSAHNMFGATHVVTLRAAAHAAASADDVMAGTDGEEQHALSSSFIVERIVHGETALDVLSRSQHSGGHMLQAMRAAAEGAVTEGRMSGAASEAMLQSFQRQLHSYTYLSL